MIKRNAHLFHTQVALQEYLDQMGDDEMLAQYTVYEGMHYIITERKMTEVDAKQFKIEQLKNEISKSREQWLSSIKNKEKLIQMYNDVSNYRMANLFVQDRDDAIDEFNEEQNKLNKELDKLNKPC